MLYNANNFIVQSKWHDKGNDMDNRLNLKELERRAFRTTYQDGLLDLTLGLIVISMAGYMFRPDEGYGPLNIILFTVSFLLANLVTWVGKWFITIPRMGQVSFGPRRMRKHRTLAILMAVVILVQATIVLITATGWGNANLGEVTWNGSRWQPSRRCSLARP